MSLSELEPIYEVPMDVSAERQILGILIKHPTQVDRWWIGCVHPIFLIPPIAGFTRSF